MKISPALKTLVAVTLSFGPVTGYSQIESYYYTGPVSGLIQVALSASYGNSGGANLISTFGTISETFYYNPTALSLEAVGSVTINPSSGTFNNLGFDLNNPGATGAATLTAGNQGGVLFDMTYQYEGNAFNGNDFSSTLSIPVEGAGIWLGNAFSESWNLQIPINLEMSAASAASITFSQYNYGFGNEPGSVVVPGTDLADGIDDGTYTRSWESSGMATALPDPMAVPDPPTLISDAMLLLPFGSSAFRQLRKKMQAA